VLPADDLKSSSDDQALALHHLAQRVKLRSSASAVAAQLWPAGWMNVPRETIAVLDEAVVLGQSGAAAPAPGQAIGGTGRVARSPARHGPITKIGLDRGPRATGLAHGGPGRPEHGARHARVGGLAVRSRCTSKTQNCAALAGHHLGGGVRRARRA